MFWCFEGVCVHPQKLDNSFEFCASKSNNLGPWKSSLEHRKPDWNRPWMGHITYAIRHETSKIFPTHHVLSKSVMKKIGALVLAQISSRPRKKNSGPAAVQRSGCSLPSVLSMVSMQRRYRSSASESSPSSSKTSLLQLAIGCLKADKPMVDIW